MAGNAQSFSTTTGVTTQGTAKPDRSKPLWVSSRVWDPLCQKAVTSLDSALKSRDITLPTKVRLVKAVVFPVVMYGCESWTVKKAERPKMDAFELWCWRTLESPLGCKDIHPVHPKADQSWVFIGRTDAEAETPILWPPDANN